MMKKPLMEREYKGFFGLLMILWLFLIGTTIIASLPKIGITGPWITNTAVATPILLGIWYIVFIGYLVKNR